MSINKTIYEGKNLFVVYLLLGFFMIRDYITGKRPNIKWIKLQNGKHR